MGRQVNFYMMEADEKSFVDFVMSTGKISILRDRSPNQEFDSVATLPKPFSYPSWGLFWLYNHAVGRYPLAQYVPEQKHYIVERFRSPVVEFSRSFVKDSVLRSGRIWAEFHYYNENGMTVQKDPRFREWYELLAKWFSRNYKRVDRMLYAGPGAQTFQSAGGRWQQNR